MARLTGVAGPAVGLVVMVALTYLPALDCGFIWDDERYVEDNATLLSVDGLGRIWFEVGATPQYYPLVHSSYWLEYRLWGLEPTGYHATNALLHGLCAVLLWRLLVLLQVRGAWVAAVIFALHPVHVESVAWVTERKNTLSGLFYLLAALAYLRGAIDEVSGPRRQRTLYLLSLLLFLAALLSKTVTATLPVVLLLVLWWRRGSVSAARIWSLAPFVAIGVAFSALTVWMEQHVVGARGQAWDLGVVERVLVAGRVLWFYPAKLLCPSRLSFIYPRWRVDHAVWWQYLFPVAALLVVLGLWLARRRLGRGPLVAVLGFVVTLAPALGFFSVYPMRYAFVADHFQYLASAFVITLLVATVAAWVADRGARWRLAARGVTVAAVATLAVVTWQRQAAFHDREALWRDTITGNPAAWMAYNNLGVIEISNGRVEHAMSLFRQALELDPDYPEARVNLGNALFVTGRRQEAETQLRKALTVEPRSVEAHTNLGSVLLSQGHAEAAAASFRAALAHAPGLARAREGLAGALVVQGRYREASRNYRLALQQAPGSAGAHHGLGYSLIRTGSVEEGLGHLETAARLRPGWPAPLRLAAWVLATDPQTNDRAAEAVALAVRAAELTARRDPAILDTLAVAHAAAGDFARAAEVAEEALVIAGPELEEAIRDRLQLFRRGQRYPQSGPDVVREPPAVNGPVE